MSAGDIHPATLVATVPPANPSRVSAPGMIHHHGSDAPTVARIANKFRSSQPLALAATTSPFQSFSNIRVVSTLTSLGRRKVRDKELGRLLAGLGFQGTQDHWEAAAPAFHAAGHAADLLAAVHRLPQAPKGLVAVRVRSQQELLPRPRNLEQQFLFAGNNLPLRRDLQVGNLHIGALL